ncbi:uncharacterized protein KY384_005680 [Bacidia gigantensis]|uniref:uncharacterized protein n=1 Tax=Bacidia gigantensis TaxID=2732470 RepID=UPI001D054B7D|nr:uncharacterized protein KY384_005680 [Bacidia gigantensis]KAG8529046.1 hypothetical protein KY384_005680 [Bacidia gigantensis]
MLISALASLALAATASATKLYVSSYTGNITTLDLAHGSNGTHKLSLIDSTPGCAANASWLRIDSKNRNLFCIDEGIVSANGSLNSFKIDAQGALKQVEKGLKTLIAPVNAAIFTGTNGSQLMAVAHYADALSTWHIDPTTAKITPGQTFNFTLSHPGPAPQQIRARPHQVRLDPTNKYFVVPDLGADLLRIFYINPLTLEISSRPSIPVTPGSGPRHGIFHAEGVNSTFYYLVSEIANTLTGFKISYLPSYGGMTFAPIVNTTTTGSKANDTTFTGNAAAEIAITNDCKSLYVSNRNASVFNIANPDPDKKNTTRIPSDSLATFDLNDATGGVKFAGLSPAGGTFPRNFALDRSDQYVAVGLQTSGRVAVYERDLKTGRLGTEWVAAVEGLGNVTSIVWGDRLA